MRGLRYLAVAMVLSALALVSSAGRTDAQTAQDLVGTWLLVSITQGQGGTKVEPFGPNPNGMLALESNGRVSLIIIRSGLPPFASKNRMKGTPEENQAVMNGTLAYYGTYTFIAADKTLVLHIAASTFPNWTGADQDRAITLAGDTLSWVDAHPSAGGVSAVVVWKRAR